MTTRQPHHTAKVRSASRAAPRVDIPGFVATGRFSAVVLAALLGAVVLYGVALSPVAHGVAHDTRHAIGFPCH